MARFWWTLCFLCWGLVSAPVQSRLLFRGPPSPARRVRCSGATPLRRQPVDAHLGRREPADPDDDAVAQLGAAGQADRVPVRLAGAADRQARVRQRPWAATRSPASSSTTAGTWSCVLDGSGNLRQTFVLGSGREWNGAGRGWRGRPAVADRRGGNGAGADRVSRVRRQRERDRPGSGHRPAPGRALRVRPLRRGHPHDRPPGRRQPLPLLDQVHRRRNRPALLRATATTAPSLGRWLSRDPNWGKRRDQLVCVLRERSGEPDR